MVDKRDALRCLVNLTHCRPSYSLAHDSQIREDLLFFFKFIIIQQIELFPNCVRCSDFIVVMFNVCRASNEVSILLFWLLFLFVVFVFLLFCLQLYCVGIWAGLSHRSAVAESMLLVCVYVCVYVCVCVCMKPSIHTGCWPAESHWPVMIIEEPRFDCCY